MRGTVNSAVEVRELLLRTGPRILLGGLALSVAPAMVTAIVGRAGAGKSALLGAIVGQVAFASGQIRVCGFDVREQPRAVRQHTTWVAGCGPLESHLTVRQNLGLIVRLSGGPAPERVDAERALRQSEVPDRAFDAPARLLTPRETLSVWLASARLRDTPVVLLDEPASRLNAMESRRLAFLIRELSAEGRGVVVTTRDAAWAQQVGDNLWMLEGGALSEGRPAAH